MAYISIINGPNIRLTGLRQPEIYGDKELTFSPCQDGIDIVVHYFSGEGDIIDCIDTDGFDSECIGIVLNAGAYTHTSLAIADAIAAVPAPVVEVHISNIFAREQIRHRSLIAAQCAGSISGFGLLSYDLAISALIQNYARKQQ